MKHPVVTRTLAAITIAALSLLGVTVGGAAAQASPGEWTYPDSHFPDGSWNRDIGGLENIGRAGYRYEGCTNELSVGFVVNPTREGLVPATFSLSLSVPSGNTSPEPNPDDFGEDVEGYFEAYAAWQAAVAPLYSGFLTATAATVGSAQHTFTVPAEALAFGSRLEIYVTVDPGFTLGGRLPVDEVNALTCDRNATGVGGADLVSAGSGEAAALPATGADSPLAAAILALTLLLAGLAFTSRSRNATR